VAAVNFGPLIQLLRLLPIWRQILWSKLLHSLHHFPPGNSIIVNVTHCRSFYCVLYMCYCPFRWVKVENSCFRWTLGNTLHTGRCSVWLLFAGIFCVFKLSQLYFSTAEMASGGSSPGLPNSFQDLEAHAPIPIAINFALECDLRKIPGVNRALAGVLFLQEALAASLYDSVWPLPGVVSWVLCEYHTLRCPWYRQVQV